MELGRGDVWWVNLNPTRGSEIKKTRPCVIFTKDAINKVRRTIVVIPLSMSAKEYYPLTISVKCNNKDVVCVLDQIRAIDKTRLEKKYSRLSGKDMQKIQKGLKIILGLDG